MRRIRIRNFAAGAVGAVLLMALGSLLTQYPVSAAAVKSTAPARGYYLTRDALYNGSQPLTACATGYHFASAWELRETSNLRYDASLGLTTPDSGGGPPSNVGGWMRTGISNAAPEYSCAGTVDTVWDTNNEFATGDNMRLSYQFISNTTDYVPAGWIGTRLACNTLTRVWCVQD